MIYIHIPYCRSFCTYCDFYSEIPKCGFVAYVDALCAEIAARAGEIPWENNSLYIGGGTPSVLPLDDLRRIVTAIAAARESVEEGLSAREAARESSGAEAFQQSTKTDSPTENDRQTQFVGKREKKGDEEKGRGQTKETRRAMTGAFEEFTVEVNPDDIVRRGVEYVRGLAALGVNRISMGVQSLDDGVLKWMNRRHNAAQAREAYRIIQEAGIDNISLDLIFGYNYPLENAAKGNAAEEEKSLLLFVNEGENSDCGEKGKPAVDLGIEWENSKKKGNFVFETKSEEKSRPLCVKERKNNDWEEKGNPTVDLEIEGENSGEAKLGLKVLGKTIDGLLNMGGDGQPPKHLSAYQLSVEEGSELAAMVASGQYVPASDEVCARQYEYVCERLAAAGYRHYEISNFALPGFEAQHNSSYWKYVPYIGFGPAAHSFFIMNRNPKIEIPNVDLPIENNARAISEEKTDTETAIDNIYIRRWNKADINAYLKAAESGDWQSIAESETLTAEQIREEKIMLALRTADGIEISELIGNSATSRVCTMLENGLLARQGSRVRIPENKFFVSNDIISDLI